MPPSATDPRDHGPGHLAACQPPPTVLFIDIEPRTVNILAEAARRAGVETTVASGSLLPQLTGTPLLAVCPRGVDLDHPLFEGVPIYMLLDEHETIGSNRIIAFARPAEHPESLGERLFVLVRYLLGLTDQHRSLVDRWHNNSTLQLAVGIMMERHRESRVSALRRLRKVARDGRRKIVEVAAEIVRKGEVAEAGRTEQAARRDGGR